MSLFWKEFTKDMNSIKIWRPFNTYGIYAISAVVTFTLIYTLLQFKENKMADDIYSPDHDDPESLEEWVMNKYENWRDYYKSNYEERFENTIGYGEVNGF